jgi:hypothetical protein
VGRIIDLLQRLAVERPDKLTQIEEVLKGMLNGDRV